MEEHSCNCGGNCKSAIGLEELPTQAVLGELISSNDCTFVGVLGALENIVCRPMVTNEVRQVAIDKLSELIKAIKYEDFV